MSESPFSSDPVRSNPQHANPQPTYPSYEQPSHEQPVYGQPASEQPSYSPPQYGQPQAPGQYGQPQAPGQYGQEAPGQWAGYDQQTAATPQPYQQAVQPYQQPAAPAYAGQHTGLAHPAMTTSGQLVSPGGRLGALLLDGLLMVVTLGLGWLIWSMFTWSEGQSPAKKMLGHVVVDPETGQPFDWGKMALRELCVKGLLGTVLNLISFGIYSWVDSLMIFGDRQRTLHDRMAGSVVRHL